MHDGVGSVGASGSLGGYTSDSAVLDGRKGGVEVAAMKQKFVAQILLPFFRAQTRFSFQIVPAYMLRDQGKVLSPKMSKQGVAVEAADEYQSAR
jgi:hypothetical protein